MQNSVLEQSFAMQRLRVLPLVGAGDVVYTSGLERESELALLHHSAQCHEPCTLRWRWRQSETPCSSVCLHPLHNGNAHALDTCICTLRKRASYSSRLFTTTKCAPTCPVPATAPAPTVAVAVAAAAAVVVIVMVMVTVVVVVVVVAVVAGSFQGS